jgi:peptide/nickel transport system substrate-binding protein
VAKAAAIPGADGCGDWATAERALFKQVDLVPFVNATVPIFGKGATFDLSEGSVIPSSIKMLSQ